MIFVLKNIKCTFVLNTLSSTLLSKFEKKRYYLILRINQSIVLTIYPSSLNRVHATGIKDMDNFCSIKSLFRTCQTKIKDIVVDNTYWLKKPYTINRFSEFASFCKENRENMDITIDLSSFALNADGYLNSIYIKNSHATGTVIIHRRCIAILGAKCSKSVEILSSKVDHLLKRYELFLSEDSSD